MKNKTIYERFVKRTLDFTLSLCGIILLLPIIVGVALLIKIKLGGSIIFTQNRPGKEGKIFKMYKFRSMTNERDENGKLLPDSRRMTKFGRLLRSTSMDELPELFNILKGDMSIIGPRPLAVEYLPYYNEEEKHRHDVKPGLTGLAQINGRTAIDWETRFQYDLEYVNNISFKLDITIFLRTIQKVLKKADVGEPGKQGDFNLYRMKQWEEESKNERNR